MKTTNAFNLEDQLKLLIFNLEEGANMFSSPDGLKTYYESIPFEITSATELLKEVIRFIKSNTDLFCPDVVFQINYENLKKTFKNSLENLKANPLVTDETTEKLQELIDCLDEIMELVDDPAEEKVLVYYQTLSNEFETTRLKKAKHYLHANIMAILPKKTDMRRKTLEHYRSKYLQKLEENKVFQCKKKHLFGNVFDEICHDGALIPESIAPTLFKHHKTIGNKEVVLDFFQLFTIYQAIQDELDKVNKSDHDTPADDNMRNWFVGLGDKLKLHAVRQELRPNFPTLINDLCQHPDLADALKKKSLKMEYNLKLAYNLFGLMMRKNLFDDNVTMRFVDNLISSQRQDQYIKAGKYNDEGKYNELNPTLRQTATEIIDSWLKNQAKP